MKIEESLDRSEELEISKYEQSSAVVLESKDIFYNIIIKSNID